MITHHAHAHEVEECEWSVYVSIRCVWFFDLLVCWPHIVRVKRCWLVDHTHEETEEDRDERVLSEMHDCIARLVDEAFAGCDTPEDEEDREACDELEMPTAYQFRNALTRRGTMTAEDPIIASTGSQCPDCLGLYLPSTVETKVNVALHEREFAAEKDGQLADTIIHEKMHRSGVGDSLADSRAAQIIHELFGGQSFVAGSCGINWELQTQ